MTPAPARDRGPRHRTAGSPGAGPDFEPQPDLVAELAVVNGKWGERFAQFQAHTALAQAPTAVLTPRQRAVWERYLPVAEYRADLAALLALGLPRPSWLPRPLTAPDCRWVPDLWRLLPESLAGRLTYARHELLPLVCALAAPARFGTRAGRYPEQLAWLRANAPTLPHPVAALDLGCGTGQGTWELAALLAAPGTNGARVTGVTREPLEVWMARQRTVPHLADAAAFAFPPAAPASTPTFRVGDALALAPAAPVALVLCNGLIGGPLLGGAAATARLWRRLRQAVAPGGVVLVGHRFHDGCAGAAEFAAARPPEFAVTALAGSLLFRRQPRQCSPGDVAPGSAGGTSQRSSSVGREGQRRAGANAGAAHEPAGAGPAASACPAAAIARGQPCRRAATGYLSTQPSRRAAAHRRGALH